MCKLYYIWAVLRSRHTGQDCFLAQLFGEIAGQVAQLRRHISETPFSPANCMQGAESHTTPHIHVSVIVMILSRCFWLLGWLGVRS
jgi:hypothetical protein